MHVVSFSEAVTIAGVTLEPFVGYLMNNTGAGSVLTNRALVKCADGHFRPIYRLAMVSPFGLPMKLNPEADYNGRTIWMSRGGGFGDLLLLTPTIREIRRRWPTCRIYFVTLPQYAPVLEFAAVDHVMSGFLRADSIGAGDAMISFEGVIEDNPRARQRHAVQLFAEHAGLEIPVFEPGEEVRVIEGWSRLDFPLTLAETGWAETKFKRNGKVRVGVQATSSSAVRTYPAQLLVAVINALIERGIEVLVFGKKGEVECEIAGVRNLAEEGLSFRESAAAMTRCDAMLVPDSSLLHVAQALGIPTVAVFASFNAELRVTNSEAVEILQATADCAPCFWHESGREVFPPEGPCRVAGFCTVLASISPERVLEALDRAIAKNPMAGAIEMRDQDGMLSAYAVPETPESWFRDKIFSAGGDVVDAREGGFGPVTTD